MVMIDDEHAIIETKTDFYAQKCTLRGLLTNSKFTGFDEHTSFPIVIEYIPDYDYYNNGFWTIAKDENKIKELLITRIESLKRMEAFLHDNLCAN